MRCQTQFCPFPSCAAEALDLGQRGRSVEECMLEKNHCAFSSSLLARIAKDLADLVASCAF